MMMTISCLLDRDVQLILVMIGTPMLQMLRRFQLMMMMTISCPPQRYQRSSEDPVDHDPADDEPDPHVFDEFENIDGIYPWGRIPPIINPITPMKMRELNRMFPFQPFEVLQVEARVIVFIRRFNKPWAI